MAEYIDKDKLENYAMGCVGGSVTIRQIHEFPAEDVAPVQKWIPVTEKLPKPYIRVLVYYDYHHLCRGYVSVHCVDAHGEWSGDDSCYITHWMELPKFPKEGE